MVIEDFRPHKNGFTKTDSKLVHALPMARPMDRLAAASVDWMAVLLPQLVTLSAPFKQVMMQALVLDEQGLFATTLISMTVTLIVAVLLYQTLMTYFWGGTLGKILFGLRVVNIWDNSRPTFGACVIRACGYLLDVLMLGLPNLSVLANDRRRPLHDKLADTVVIATKSQTAGVPLALERSFVRGIYSAVTAVVLVVTIGMGLALIRQNESEQNLSGWLSGTDRNDLCEVVTAATEQEPGSENQTPDRLSVAMALFAAGLADRDCLAIEADHILHHQQKETALAYLAKAFIHSEDKALSNAYLEQTCKMDPQSESCILSSIVGLWAKDNWIDVEEKFNAMAQPLSLHAAVWMIRYKMKREQYDQVLHYISQVSVQTALAPFLGAQRTKALWRMNRQSDARLIAAVVLENLPSENQVELAAWLCYEELTSSCSETRPNSCQVFERGLPLAKEIRNQPIVELATIVDRESCHSPTSPDVYQALANESVHEDIHKLLTALIDSAESKVDTAKERLIELASAAETSEAVRDDALRRLVDTAQTRTELAIHQESWQKLTGYHRRWIGSRLVKTMSRIGDYSTALEFGEKLLNENRDDLQLNRDLVIAAYRLGRRQDAWALLKSYRSRLEIFSQGRAPAGTDEFAVISRVLSQDFRGK